MTCRAILFATGLMFCLMMGCGSKETGSVHGTITSGGKPLTSGLINFQPAQGQPLGGAINADGTFEFELPPGQYKVRVDAPGVMPPYKEGDPEPKPGPRLAPAKYANYETSGLSITVTGESPQQQDFDLP
jgi:hypothetical protein